MRHDKETDPIFVLQLLLAILVDPLHCADITLENHRGLHASEIQAEMEADFQFSERYVCKNDIAKLARKIMLEAILLSCTEKENQVLIEIKTTLNDPVYSLSIYHKKPIYEEIIEFIPLLRTIRVVAASCFSFNDDDVGSELAMSIQNDYLALIMAERRERNILLNAHYAVKQQVKNYYPSCNKKPVLVFAEIWIDLLAELVLNTRLLPCHLLAYDAFISEKLEQRLDIESQAEAEMDSLRHSFWYPIMQKKTPSSSYGSCYVDPTAPSSCCVL